MKFCEYYYSNVDCGLNDSVNFDIDVVMIVECFN